MLSEIFQMPGKKAKATAKTTAKKAAPKPEKGGTLGGSIKKMLGLAKAPQKLIGKKPDKDAVAPKMAAKSGAVAKSGAAAKSGVVAKTTAGKEAVKAVPPKKGAVPGKADVAAKPAGRTSKSAPSALERVAVERGARASKATGEPVLTGAPVCREVACELMATTGGYCRMHYIKNWKKIKRKEIILREKKLNSYIDELVSKYPDKYIEAIRQDLASEKDFAKVIADLEIEEGLDDFESVETESAEGIIDNIKRDFEDEGDVF